MYAQGAGTGGTPNAENGKKYKTITVPGTMGMGGRPIVSQVGNNPNWQAMTQKPSKPSDWQYIGYKKTDSDFGSDSGSGSGSSSSAANYYAAMLAQVQAAQDAAARRAEELARQKQEAAQAAYDKNMGYLNEAYANRSNLLQQSYNDALAQLQASYDSGARGVNRNADSAQQQAYINYMMSKRDLPQALAAQGLTGGMSESALAGMYNSYGNNRNTIDRGRNDSLATLLDTLNSNKSTALQNYNNQLSADDQQKMAYQLQLEQALANQSAEILQNKYDTLQNLDNTYTQQMLALQQAQAEAAAKAASRSYSSGGGNSSVSTSQGDIDESFRINAAKAYQNAYTNAVSNGITDDIATTQAVNAMKQYYYSLFQNNLISADQYAAMMA
ncbi:hypothetical protein [Ruthenibacterium lactatiformans]|uniref:hypothetical protein n=1 Tax=Ruthenibacterium lactatiformans TaxID=1550024 RepID=UPI0039A23C0A